MEEKKSNPIKIFLYISLWVIIWGTLGSLIDYPLYKNKIYIEGSIYQYLTFTIAAMISIVCAKFFYKKFKL
jgi:cytochrome c oxidase subunit IV